MTSTAARKDIQDFRAICRRISKDMKRLRIPGAAIGVWHEGREHSAGFGVTSIENPLPVTPDTLFQVGSISKTFTATLLMELVEQGRLDLDAPVRRYLPELKLRDKSVARRITTRHLLTHMGGWVGDYFDDFGNGDDALAKMVKAIGRLRQTTPLGSIWSYNNTGFNIAARLIEVLTRKPYERAVQEMLLDPLGLKMTFFFPSDELITYRFVVGHYSERGKVHVARPWAIGRASNGVGGVVSTVRDLLKYARFHMDDGRVERGGRIVRQSTLRAMRVPQADAGEGRKMCISWFLREEGGLKIYSHGGATKGQHAGLYFIPAKGFALAILTNSDKAQILTDSILNWALEIYFDRPSSPPKARKMSSAQLREYAGHYDLPLSAFDLKVKNGHLVFHDVPRGGFPTPAAPPDPALPSARFAFYEKDRIIGLDEPFKGAFGEFFRDASGRVRFLRFSGRVHKKTR